MHFQTCLFAPIKILNIFYKVQFVKNNLKLLSHTYFEPKFSEETKDTNR
jgi:hypothetical protein